ncbi:hypothetical protein Asal01_01586 [Fodinibius salicampi]
MPGDQPEFYLLQFLEPGNTKTPDLSWADAGDFTGRVSLFDEAGEKVLATIYKEGEVTDFIPEETKDEFEMWDNTRGKTDTDEMQLVCVTVTTHHCTDWYRVYSDGSREYTGRTCSGSTTSRVCSSGGGGGSGGDGGSTGGSGGDSGGGSSGDGGAPCGDPVHGCFEMEVKDKIVGFMGTIGIDTKELDKFPKLKCTVDRVLDTNSMQDLIAEFGMSYTNYDLIFSGAPILEDENGDEFLGGLDIVDDNDGRKNFVIMANNHLAQDRSSVEVAITYLHEAMHAEMRRYLLDNADTSTLQNFPGSITEDWKNYVATRNQENAEHIAMAKEYVDFIAQAASDFDNNRMSFEYYQALSWIGLSPDANNVWYTEYTPQERTQILNNLDAAKEILEDRTNKMCN